MPLNSDVTIWFNVDRGSRSTKQNGERICYISSNLVLSILGRFLDVFQLHVSNPKPPHCSSLPQITIICCIFWQGGGCFRFPFPRWNRSRACAATTRIPHCRRKAMEIPSPKWGNNFCQMNKCGARANRIKRLHNVLNGRQSAVIF